MFDLIVVGLGIYGSSVVAEAGAQGLRTLGLEQFPRGHKRGSSHGRSRLFRLTAIESQGLVIRARRALDHWKSYDAETPEGILVPTGFAIIQRSGAEHRSTHDVSHIVSRARTVAQRQHITHRLFSGSEFVGLYPGLDLSKHDRVFYEPEAYVIRADVALTATLNRASSHPGVELVFETPVAGLRSVIGGVEVSYGGTSSIARHVVLCTGPWRQRQLLGEDVVEARVLPQLALTAEMNLEAGGPQIPAFVQVSAAEPTFYCVPPSSRLPELKFGIEQGAYAVTAPAQLHLPPHLRETLSMLALDGMKRSVPSLSISEYVPDLCYYTTTSGSQHVVRRVGVGGNVTVVSSCSGHGFKYAPAVAEEIVSDLSRQSTRTVRSK